MLPTEIITATVKKGNLNNTSVIWDYSEIISFTQISVSGNVISIKATSNGSGFITATSADNTNFKAVCYISVSAASSKLVSIDFGTSSIMVRPNEEVTVNATTNPATATDELEWITSNSSVVTVSSTANGRTATIKGVADGSATVTAYSKADSRISKSIQVSVSNLVTPITVTSLTANKTSAILSLTDKNIEVVSVVVNKNGKASTGSVIWNTTDVLGLVETSTTGNSISIKGKAVGSGFITASSVDDP